MNFSYLLSLLLVATCSFNVQAADDRWFDVEILVFKRNIDVQKISEQLDQNNVYLKKQQRLEVLKAKQATDCLTEAPCLHEQNPVQITNDEITSKGHRLQQLNSSHLKLKSELSRLENHQLFKPLLHVAWRMPIQSKQDALPLHLFAGENYALDIYKDEIIEQRKRDAENKLKATVEAVKEPNLLVTTPEHKLDVLAALQKKENIHDLYEIDGNLLIYVERYLHLEGQLIVRTETEKEVLSAQSVLENPLLTEGESEIDADAGVQILNQQPITQKVVETKTVVTETLFDQTRRLRSEEIHYLDHPLFGIIIQIRKIEE